MLHTCVERNSRCNEEKVIQDDVYFGGGDMWFGLVGDQGGCYRLLLRSLFWLLVVESEMLTTLLKPTNIHANQNWGKQKKAQHNSQNPLNEVPWEDCFFSDLKNMSL